MVDVHLNWLNRFHFFILRYCDRLHDFSVTWMLYFNLFFPSTARLWNSMTAECCHLTYDRNGFRSRINRHLLSLDSFWTVFLQAFHIFFFPFLFLVTPCLLVALQPCMAWIPIRKKKILFMMLFASGKWSNGTECILHQLNKSH